MGRLAISLGLNFIAFSASFSTGNIGEARFRVGSLMLLRLGSALLCCSHSLRKERRRRLTRDRNLFPELALRTRLDGIPRPLPLSFLLICSISRRMAVSTAFDCLSPRATRLT
ncbi:MAG TPA: hypothetical protein VK641_07395 [Terriglobales bacterium]|nr:hypothetical protein [Terriglobales bacterium]